MIFESCAATFDAFREGRVIVSAPAPIEGMIFESCAATFDAFREGRVFVSALAPIEGMIINKFVKKQP